MLACGGSQDRDGDGVPNGRDCGPDDPFTYPDAPESCDGQDHDCDGEVNEAGALGVQGRGFLSLQDALDAAEEDAVITVCGGEHQGPFITERSVTLRGLRPYTLQGSADASVLRSAGARLTLADATVEGGGGYAYSEGGETWGGGVMMEGGALTLEDCLISGNSATYGAGVAITGEGSLTLNNTRIESNTGELGGGVAMVGYGTPLTLQASTITLNTADYGAGLYLQSEGAGVVLRGDPDSALSENTAQITGGGVYLSVAGGDVDVSGLRLLNNQASGSGGMQLVTDGAATLTLTHFEGNRANVSGGGLYYRASGGTLSLDSSTLTGNEAAYGGGLFVELAADCVVTATTTTLDANSASQSGGGVEVFANTSYRVDLSGLTVTGNEAPFGGGVYLGRSAGMTVSNLDISLNEAGVAGGGLYQELNAPGLQISEVQISDNLAPYGAGLYVYLLDSSAALSATEVLVSRNTADYGGGVWLNQYGGAVTLSGLTVQENHALGGGGGLYAWFEGDGLMADLSGSSFQDNSTDGWGGGLYLSGWIGDGNTLSSYEVSVRGVDAHNNSANTGGGLHVDAGDLSLDLLSLTGNSAVYGGGLSADLAQGLHLQEADISANEATVSGGGAYVRALWPGGALSGNGRITDNLAYDGGGGLVLTKSTQYDANPSALLEGLVLYGNEADRGGGLWVGVNTQLTQAAIAGNLAHEGGGVWLSAGTLVLDAVDLGAGKLDNAPDDIALDTETSYSGLGADTAVTCLAGSGCY